MHDTIVFQANCVFDVLEEMIRSIPAKEMVLGNRPREVLARQALHILGAFDRYSTKGQNSVSRFGESYGRFGKRFPAEEIPGKKRILDYLKVVRGQFGAFVRNLPEDYFGKDASNKRGRYQTNLGKYLYLIRHNTLHLGYMRDAMIRRGHVVAQFK